MTPDLKKIAAEMRKHADVCGNLPLTEGKLRAWAEALDPTPSMGIEEAIQVAREWAKTEILGTGPIVDALSVIVAHYEATKQQHMVLWQPDREAPPRASCQDGHRWICWEQQPGDHPQWCPVCYVDAEKPAPTRAPGEKGLTVNDAGQLLRAAKKLDAAGHKAEAGHVRGIAKRVVRP